MPEADFSAEAEAEEDFGSIEIPSESPGLPQMDSELPQEEPEISEEDLGSADDGLGDDIIIEENTDPELPEEFAEMAVAG